MALNAAKIAEKWAKRAGAAGPDYSAGVTGTSKDQAALAIAANDNYVAGLAEANAAGRFVKGLNKSGKAKWLKGASGKGVTNYPVGVRAATADYQGAVQPFLTALDGIQYPPKGPRRSPNNIERVKAVMDAMAKVKEAS